jgi:hypothetical protein
MSNEERRTYETTHRLLKVVDGKEMWVPDRRPYYRLRYQQNKEATAIKIKKRWARIFADPELTAQHRDYQRGYADEIRKTTGRSKSALLSARRRLRKKLGTQDKEVLYREYAARNLLTPTEKDYLAQRKPLRRLVNQEANNVRAAAQAIMESV